MGWFSNPKCPRCGRESTEDTDGLTRFYTCLPCKRDLRKEKQDKEQLEERVKVLEEALSLNKDTQQRI